MNQKFLFVVLATIWFESVCSSPVNEQKQISDIELPEEKPPTISPDHVNKKPEPTPAPPADHLVSLKQNATTVKPVLEIHENITAQKNTSNSSAVDVVNSKNVTGTVINVNITQSNTSKINPQPAVNNVSQANATSSNSIHAGNSSSSSTSPKIVPSEDPKTKNSTSPKPEPSEESKTNASTSVTNNTNPPTTIKIPTTKPTSVTSAPETASTNSVLADHNTPAQSEGSHFDGPSFIGGIVLTIGLTAIGFIAFKYYKSGRIDMNYRTL